MSNSHFEGLIRMFHSAPIQEILMGAAINLEEGKAEYELEIKRDYFHAAEALHGAIYFKLLDDSAYFAAATLEREYFLLTKSYQIHFKRPVQEDTLIAKGEVLSRTEKEIIASSVIYNAQGKVVANGEGVFVRSKKLLSDQPGFFVV